MDTFDDGDFRTLFRFMKVDVSKLLIQFRFPEYVNVEFRYKVSGEECFLILLRRLSYPTHFTAMKDMFGRSKSALSSIFNFALDFVYQKCKHLLSFDWERLTPSYLDRMCALNTAKGCILENCVGFIDGTVRPICRPGERQRMYFNGHKRIHALKYQSIVFPDGIIVFADGPYSGNRHDAGMFRDGQLREIFGERLKGANGSQLCFYGDAAYPAMPFMLGPYKGSSLTPEETFFNGRMSSIRIPVEWSFGKVSNLFAFQSYKQNIKLQLQPVGFYFLVATALTNCHTCFYRSQINEYFESDPPTIEEYLNIH